jgi:hypothetical protein
MSDTIPTPFPSPVPPWHRPVQSPTTQEINESLIADGISLNTDVTYLNSSVPLNAEDLTAPYVVALPNGNYKRQIKRIFIKRPDNNPTAVFSITGTFIGFTSLLMKDIATAAVLEWDGLGWHLIGGNAETI